MLPGAEFVAAASSPSRTVRFWDGRVGKLLAVHAVDIHVRQLVFSPDGATVAAIDTSEGIHLIQRTSGAVSRIGSKKTEHPRSASVAFSPDGTRVATIVVGIAKGGDPDPVSIWEAATGRWLATFPGRREELEGVTFAPDGQSLYVSSTTGVRLWQIGPRDGAEDAQPAGHKDEAWSLSFSPDGRFLATGSDDSEPDPTIKLWETGTGRLIRAWPGGHGTVAALAFSPEGRFLASAHLASGDNVHIWDALGGAKLTTLQGHTDRVRTLAFARDGKSLATAGSDGTIRLWDVASWSLRSVLRGHADTVHAVAYSPDDRILASASNDGDVRLWDLRPGEDNESPPRVLHNRANLMAVAFARDGKTLAVADDIGSVTIWDLDRRVPIRLIHSDRDTLFQLAFTVDGTALAAAGKQGLIRFWDPATGQELMTLAAPSRTDQCPGVFA